MKNKLNKKSNMGMNKSKMGQKDKFLILNLIILLLTVILFLLIFVESAFTSIGVGDYSYRLVPGTEYRFSRFNFELEGPGTGTNGFSGMTRIIYSSGSTYDLFLPLNTIEEWIAFTNHKPSTITFTYPTCEMSVSPTLYWGKSGNYEWIYECSGSNQRCYNGVCKTCSGYMYSDGCSGCAGQGGQACWHYVAKGVSCTTGCSNFGGCVAANWNDDSSCTVCKQFHSGCQGGSDSYGPNRHDGDWSDTCWYRKTGGQSCGSSDKKATRLCVCNY